MYFRCLAGRVVGNLKRLDTVDVPSLARTIVRNRSSTANGALYKTAVRSTHPGPAVRIFAECSTADVSGVNRGSLGILPANSQRRLYSEDVSPNVNVDVLLMRTLMKCPNTLVVDIREPDEIVEVGGILGATNIPSGDLVSALEMPPAKFKSVYGVDQPHPKDTTVLIYCARGNRSLVAVNATRKLGYDRSWHLVGGFTKWLEEVKQD